MLITKAVSNVCKVLMHAVTTDRELTEIKDLVNECQIPEQEFTQSINKIEDFIADAKAIVEKIDSL